MKMSKGLTTWVLALCLAVQIPVFAAVTAEQAETLNNMVKGALSQRDNILKMGAYKDFRVYRDGDRFGVIYDYIVVDNQKVTINKNIKSVVVAGFRSPETAAVLKPHFDNGLYIRFNYLRSDGTVLHTFTITKADFDGR